MYVNLVLDRTSSKGLDQFVVLIIREPKLIAKSLYQTANRRRQKENAKNIY
jgi:hypothetical protein